MPLVPRLPEKIEGKRPRERDLERGEGAWRKRSQAADQAPLKGNKKKKPL